MTYLRERLGNTIEAEMYRRLREWWDNNKGAIVLPAPGSPITDRGRRSTACGFLCLFSLDPSGRTPILARLLYNQKRSKTTRNHAIQP